MSRFILLVVFLVLCTTEASRARLEHQHGHFQKLRRELDAQKNGQVPIVFIPPEDHADRPRLDPAVYHPVPILGTQPPAVRPYPTVGSKFTERPLILTADDIKANEAKFGDDTETQSEANSMVSTAESHSQPDETPMTPPPDAPVDQPLEPAPLPPAPVDGEIPGEPDMGGEAMSSGVAAPSEEPPAEPSDNGGDANAQNEAHKFRHALHDEDIPKWLNVLNFVDEENGHEFVKARDEAVRLVNEELSKFKTETIGLIMSEFGKLMAGDAESDGGDGDDDDYGYDGDYDYDGDYEGDGEMWHQGYLAGEDDASHAPNDYDYEWEDKEPGNEMYDEDDSYDGDADAAVGEEAAAPADAAEADAEAVEDAVEDAAATPSEEAADEAGDDVVVDDAAAAADDAETPQDAKVIADLQSQVDAMKSEVVEAHAAEQSAEAQAQSAEASAAAAGEAAAPVESAPAEAGAAVAGATEGDIASPSSPGEMASEGGSYDEAATPAETTEEAVADAAADEEEGAGDEEEGADDDYDYGYGDDYDYDYGYGDDYDYDYDYGDGSEEWGHDSHGHWGRKSGGGGGWAMHSSQGGVRTTSVEGGNQPFTTVVATGKPATVHTVLATTIVPIGHGQSAVSQNVERVEVTEYDEGVGEPGWPGISPEPFPAPGAGAVGGSVSVSEPAATPVTEPAAAPVTEPAATPVTEPAAPAAAPAAAHSLLSEEAQQALNRIHQEGSMIKPVHVPDAVDLANLQKLESSSEDLLNAADQYQRIASFKEKRHLERLLGIKK